MSNHPFFDDSMSSPFARHELICRTSTTETSVAFSLFEGANEEQAEAEVLALLRAFNEGRCTPIMCDADFNGGSS